MSNEKTWPAQMRKIRGLLSLLLVVVGTHSLIILLAPDRTLFGDELIYAAHAIEDAESGDNSLLPGTLRFDWRPEFASRLYSKFVREGIDDADLLRSISVVHLALLTALLVFMYLQARWLGLGETGALVTCGLLGFFPWFGFYVHALWPEVIHAFFLGAALCLIQRFLITRNWAWLLLAGAALGFSLLTKGVVNMIVPFLAVYVAGASLLGLQRVNLPRGRASVLAVLHTASLLAGVALVIGPQLVSNASQGHGVRLASNRWINVELGLLRPPASEQPSDIYAQYRRDANGVGSEEGSRARVLEHLATQSSFQVLGAQISKWLWMVSRSTSFLERSIHNERWGAEASTWLKGLGILGRGMWYLIFAVGMVGAALYGMRSPGWGLLALMVLYFAVALLAIPIKVRFAMPLVPVLCFFCGAMAERGMDRFKRLDPGQQSTSS